MAATVPFNHFNLPAVDQAAQRTKANEFALDRAEVTAGRQDTEYDDDMKMKSTGWLAGATKVLMDVYDKDPDQFYVAADELSKVGIERGIIDPDKWDPELVTIDAVRDMHNGAMVGLGGMKAPGQETSGPAKVQQYEYYRDNVAGDPQNEAIWDQSTQVDKGMKTIKVPMPDGSELMVNYDPQSGQGYDLESGQTMIVRPGGGGQPLVYGEQGLVGPGQAAQVPQGFGQSQNPADKKQAELETTREFQMEKVVEQQMTAMENAFRLEPMMVAAVEGANAWNTSWGSLLQGIPGSSAKDLASTVTTIKANIGFDRLQKMRAESPTGGALGQVAVQELVALQSTISNLDQSQSTPQFQDNMKIALEQYQSWRKKWGRAIMQEGTRDQKMRYYQMVPAGSWYYHPNGEYIQKQR